MALLTVSGKVLLADGKPVNAPSGGATQEKSITITENGTTTITPDVPYDAMSKVDVTVNVAEPTIGLSFLSPSGSAVDQIFGVAVSSTWTSLVGKTTRQGRVISTNSSKVYIGDLLVRYLGSGTDAGIFAGGATVDPTGKVTNMYVASST